MCRKRRGNQRPIWVIRPKFSGGCPFAKVSPAHLLLRAAAGPSVVQGNWLTHSPDILPTQLSRGDAEWAWARLSSEGSGYEYSEPALDAGFFFAPFRSAAADRLSDGGRHGVLAARTSS